MARQQIAAEDLDKITGGKITFTWSSEDQIGTIGIDGNNFLTLLDRDAFGSYYKSVAGTMSDGRILKQLIAMGIAKYA